MQEKGELLNELWLRQTRWISRIVEAVSPISGLENLACSISRKAQSPKREGTDV